MHPLREIESIADQIPTQVLADISKRINDWVKARRFVKEETK